MATLEDKSKILNKWGNIVREKANKSGIGLDRYLTQMIDSGEKFYGSNFIQDLLNENANNTKAVENLIDEVMLKGRLTLGGSVKSLPTGQTNTEVYQSLANSVQAAANKKKNEALAGAFKMALDSKKAETFVDLESKKQALLSKYKEVIEKKIFGNHFDAEKIKDRLDYNQELDQGLAALIVNGEAKYGSSFVADLYGKSEEEVKSVLSDLSRYIDDEKVKASSEIANNGVGKDEVAPENPVMDNNAAEKNDTPKEENDEDLDLANDVSKYGDADLDFGLDDIDGPINEKVSEMVPSGAKLGKRKEAPQGLISKFKEKWKDPKFKKKVIVGAIVIAAGLTATAVVIANVLATQSIDTQTITTVSNAVNDAINNSGLANNVDFSSVTNSIDYSGIGQGDTIYSDAYSAVSNLNPETASQWVGNTPMDVFDTVSGQYMNLTPEQLNDAEFMQNLMADGNHSLLVGQNGEASGFINADGFEELINSGRSR